MKKIAIIIMVLALAPAAWAKNLAPASSYNPASDSVYTAVDNLRGEVVTLYEWINALFKLQAASTCSASGNSTYDLCLDTDGPVLKYWNGSAWTSLIESSTQYSSGLTFELASRGTSHNCTLEFDPDVAAGVEVKASTALPCTLVSDGEELQVTSDVTLNLSAAADGWYYVYASRTGSTTAFTLARDQTGSSSNHYLGEVKVASAVPVIVRSYDQQHQGQVRYGFGASRSASYTITTSPAKMNFVNNLWFNSENFDLGDDSFTPTKAGWYEVTVVSTSATGSANRMCVAVYKNAAAYARHCSNYDMVRKLTVPVWMNGSTDSLTFYEWTLENTIATTTTLASDNAAWGRYLGQEW